MTGFARGFPLEIGTEEKANRATLNEKKMTASTTPATA